MDNQKLSTPSEMAGRISLGTYYDYYEQYGLCTILQDGRVAGYKKEDWPSPTAQPNLSRSNSL